MPFGLPHPPSLAPVRRFGSLVFAGLFALSLALTVPAFVTTGLSAQPDAAAIDFATQIKPILTTHCVSCHGPDEAARQADLRLDDRAVAVASGAIQPGNPDRSSLVERILSDAPDLQMPPPDFKRPLSDDQKRLLQTWIAQDAPFTDHWAFEPPSREAYERFKSLGTDTHPIDHFVRQRLDREAIRPAEEADRATLLRRVTLDLTGLPPTPQQIDEFLGDDSPDAYERVVDRLLASKSYAERMTMEWLDLARYADTNGYNNDEDRTMWPWRDWVIDAFDTNMPYDRFIVEQLAGDQLTDPTQDQLVATAFLRNQGHNTEGGIIQEEYRVEYVADRVHTTATVFLGLSMQCARCHDHKYDPISHSEYFQFYAYFNNLDEKQASYSQFMAAEPFIRAASRQQTESMRRLEDSIAESNAALQTRRAEAESLLEDWISAQPAGEIATRFGNALAHHLDMTAAENQSLVDSVSGSPTGLCVGNPIQKPGRDGDAIELDGQTHWVLESVGDFDGDSPLAIFAWVNPAAPENGAILSKMDESAGHRGYDLLLENGKLTTHLIHQWPGNAIKVSAKQPITQDEWHHVALVYDGGRSAAAVKIYVDGQLQETEIHSDTLTETISTEKPFHVGRREVSLPFKGLIDDLKIVRGKVSPDQVAQAFSGQPITGFADWAQIAKADRTDDQTRQMVDFFIDNIDEESARLRGDVAAKQAERKATEDALPAVMVMRDMPTERETFVLHRGEYDKPGERVAAGVPAVLGVQPDGDLPRRLALAKWLVDPRNPLTARVAVNRWWQHYFGAGLVKTVEDFGVTGDPPTHPELLDYLAISFIDSGWDVKALQKSIVMSSTYRQSSRAAAEAWQRDPENRLLARGPRYRLPAETVRDQALAISGLLVERIGGPSVKPYQPDGLWEDVSVERRAKYVADQGDGLYRRSMYTFWKRTCPPPALMNFDAPNREVCFARRPRTNTPLQSLVLMNDPTYVEAARVLAQVMLGAENLSDSDRINAGYRRCLARPATADEARVMGRLLAEAREAFAADPAKASALGEIGASRPGPDVDAVELAAWTVLASTLLNLDETVSKR
jgi:mono/diheme cytochrome c family protein